jgi:outer membrane biosynthesis protein TonB
MKSHEEQELRAQVGQVRGRLEGLAADLLVVDGEIESLAPQRTHHELLDQACGSLEKLGELGAASLFWGKWIEPETVAEQLRGVRSRVSAFQAQLGKLDERRRAILAKIDREEENLEILGEDLYQVREAEERRKLEWVVERDISPLPPRVQRMAWARGGDDDRRFHKSLAGSLLAGLLLGALLPMIDLPLPKRFVPEEMPKRLAQLVRPELAKPLPKAPAVPETPSDQKPPEQPEPVEEPTPSEKPPEEPVVAAAGPAPSEEPGPGPEGPGVGPGEPRKQVAKAGILAFRDQFASLAKDDVAPRLGADARYGDADDVSKGLLSTRSMLTTNAPGSSGGINLGSLSRNVGGGGQGGPGGGGGIEGVPLGRATSAIAAIGGGGGGDRPRARGGQAASRTDEEIQIVFDRYKASFYRLYNRELRNDPTLQGQMVLRLTIEPDGSVSMCKLQSTDMDAPDLAAQVVDRVRKINFGAKEGVEAMTIVYPIDFLPAA